MKIYFNIPYQIQRKIKSRYARALLTKCSLFFKPNSFIELNDDEKKQLTLMNELGWCSLGKLLSEQHVETLRQKLNSFPLEDRFRKDLGYFTLENVPKESHVASYVVNDWNQVPEVIDIANSQHLLRIAQSYLGCKPTISNLQVWWSFPGHRAPEQAEFFHRDVDDWKFVKLFVYLTDVDEDSGPHVYVQKSCLSRRNLPIRRYSDKEIEKNFGKENIISMIGKKGEAILEDTFGFHKGQLAKSNRRLLLQVQYSINPIAISEYNSRDSKLDYDPYINRLYLNIGK